MLNLSHLARTINSLIGRKSLSKQTKWRTYCFTKRERKFQHREIGLDQLTDEELRSRYSFDQVYLVGIRKDDLQRQTTRNRAMFPIFRANFRAIFFLEAAKQAVEKLVEQDFLVLIWD